MAEEEGAASISDSQFIEEIAARKNEVDKLLTKKDKAGALALCLRSPPVGTKNAEIKVGDENSTKCNWFILFNIHRIPMQPLLTKF
jgi:hypothetical protein